ncbi:MAG: carbohydrate transporter substrate-binding protein family [Devosia sp.]|uniref:ABC transporter substrate-binding protein n=1 Tax=Devosia sp. TaxID=1871048 RepID=UPI0026089969|nr:sugar ABC transporter substrate-binding protein [Devosia sp.]MDB5538694.1 carbohydrate transporter substrate-binding protein family [Devosia sp.]
MKLLELTKATALAALLFATPAIAQSADPLGVDDGTTLTLWTRAATEARADQLIQAYNATHKNQVTATYVVTDDYQTKVGAAAAANGLPDLFSADVVFMPNWTSAGLFQDITDKINAMPDIDKVAQAGINVATWEGKKYGMPFVADLSVWMWNKKLYKEAGLDPEKGPTTLQEFSDQARAVAKLGNGVYGTFWGGNCGGCEVFTWFPIAWADGETIMNPEGTESHANSEEWKAIFKVFHDLAADGIAPMPDTQNEAGPTWTSYFPKGTIGVMPMPATLVGLSGGALADADIGVTPIAGLKGGQSTFIGGDDIGISRDSKKADAAWNFIAWLQSEEAQVEVVAKNGNVLTRSDLANNKYSAADPRLVLFNEIAAKGQTPLARNFGATFNDPQGPWLVLMRDAVFGDGANIDANNEAMNDSLNQ